MNESGALRYNLSIGQIFVPNLTVAGTSAIVTTTTIILQNAIVFDGERADAQKQILRHNHIEGLIIKFPNTSDNSAINLTFQTGETDNASNDVIVKISFQATDEATGTDAIIVAASIQSISEDEFSFFKQCNLNIIYDRFFCNS